MNIHKIYKSISPAMLFLVASFLFTACAKTSSQPDWPDISQQAKPWTRWWWMGSSVDKSALTSAMQAYKKAGLGGVEITPIYGVKDNEDKFITYLSSQWMDMLQHTLQEGQRLDLGVDMATGTGWPFGGPSVSSEEASRYITYKKYSLKSGQILNEPVTFVQTPLVRAVGHRIDISELVEPVSANENLQKLALDQVRFEKQLPLQTLMAYSDQGEILELTEFVDQNGNLNWKAPDGNWELYALFSGWHGKMVERAAPGGEGYVIDHFSSQSIKQYLKRFDQAFDSYDVAGLRAFFNDSYEVDDAQGQANWTPAFFDEFQTRRGYDLHSFLPDLFDKGATEKSKRIICDFHVTISDLLFEEFTSEWNSWAESKKAITRNQAHGSPANILDLYAASGIPETEGNDLLGIKLASSAANLSGKILTSSETATWLDEHFLASLGDVKKAVDLFFLGGVNHIVYHGTTFSPPNESWPGWMFYASVHFGPSNSFWKDFHILNNYVARSQSFLQNSQPDNDVLLYFPFYDLISQPGREMLHHIGSHISSLPLPNFLSTSRFMVDKGYALDYISDHQIKNLQYKNGMLISAQSKYNVIVIPETNFIPLETIEKIIDLARQGAQIIIQTKLPADVPGFHKLQERREKLAHLIEGMQFTHIKDSLVKKSEVGDGMVYLGTDLDEMLAHAKIKRETLTDKGMQFIRKNFKNGKIYFINNTADEFYEGWTTLATDAVSAALYNPINNTFGQAGWRKSESGNSEVYLQLYPGETIIVQTFKNDLSIAYYPYLEKVMEKQIINGSWTLEFVEGGPVLPETITTSELASWTEIGDVNTRAFSGTVEYTIDIKFDIKKNEDMLLDLGQVHESAVVEFNGKEIASLITYPYQCVIPAELIQQKNHLKVIVTNLMANRIAHLDKQSSDWKKFYNINFPSRLTENRGADGLFTAKHWVPRESGLQGPVTIIPVKNIEFSN